MCHVLARVRARNQEKVEEVSVSDSVMLVCAVLASLALGVLAAYGVCLCFFAAFRMRTAKAVVKPAAGHGSASGPVGVVEG